MAEAEKLKGWKLIRLALKERKTAVMLAFGFGAGLPYKNVFARVPETAAQPPSRTSGARRIRTVRRFGCSVGRHIP